MAKAPGEAEDPRPLDPEILRAIATLTAQQSAYIHWACHADELTPH